MNKIGVISDVHGNLEALTSILNLFKQEHCDEIIHTGDVVDIGPCSRECLSLLLSLPNVTLLLGNHDRDFALNDSRVQLFSHVPEEHKRRVFDSMSEALRDAVLKFPLFVTRRLGKSNVLFTHYAFKQEPFDIANYPFYPLITSPSACFFDDMFNGLDYDAVFFGHKHEPCDLQGKMLYVDVGSVGCHPEPVARGIIIEYNDESWSYRRVEVPYDMSATHKKMKEDTANGEELYDFYFLHNKKRIR